MKTEAATWLRILQNMRTEAPLLMNQDGRLRRHLYTPTELFGSNQIDAQARSLKVWSKSLRTPPNLLP